MSRTGQDYIKGLRDGRCVLIGGEKVTDVTEHPAFRNAVRSVARLYDAAAADPETFSYVEDDGEQHNVIWKRPKDSADLAARRRAHDTWAALTHGLIGRSPDHVASYITAMATTPGIADLGGRSYSENLMSYWRYLRDNDLYVTYAVTAPGRARSSDVFGKQQRKAEADASHASPAAHVVRTDDEGIVVRGTKLLATSAVLADEIFVGSILPLSPGEEQYAVTFATPVGAPGVKVMPRKSFEQYVVGPEDDPLAFRYDETDCVIFFDDVHVPWERVFSYRDLDTGLALFTQTSAHVLGNAQAQSRLLAKMRLALGIVRKVSEVTGTWGIPAVREAFAVRATEVGMLEGLIAGQDADPHQWPSGYVSPNLQTLYATTSWATEHVPGFFLGLQELLGSHPFQQAADASVFESEETRAILLEAFGLDSAEDARNRYRLVKTAWDLVGSEFASRHIQYEMFYAGAKHVTRARMNQYFSWDFVQQEAQRCLDELDTWIATGGPAPV
ncbi:4-hydroxyphenylacetate 3-hydroxylase family protein [Streptomyces sp. TP-A0874]|uniref:4-hydroxyphenylacetate 3-hydroxylase family protein n=1 Tax=Streptomyces sp. TP-A0874 TaxID=549819 RepID=UPI000852FA29|nr:4-hydroxyphenylacetate 3-hydroxylase N-terminal domain-containing protein [Streptomyces sp. TP-A0874]